jgi:3D (Asp-Asp-Asp) domain-containing protein
MKNLVRGGLILSIVGALVVFVYAQTKTEYVPVIANDSQLQFNINSNSSETNNLQDPIKKEDLTQDKAKDQKTELTKEEQDSTKDKKLIDKTVSSKAVGANRGSFVATAYCLRGRTASGSMVRSGIIAADPRVLRLGTKVNLGAGAHSGNYTVTDTGGKIKGKRIDIWMASCSEARRFGRRTVTVNVFELPPPLGGGNLLSL